MSRKKTVPGAPPAMCAMFSFDPGTEWKPIGGLLAERFDGAFLHSDGRRALISLGRFDRSGLRVDGGGKRWLHVSVSRPGAIPNYEDMCEVKARFVGKHRRAIEVFPEERFHVNINPFVRHLWACLDDDGLPEFSTPKPGGGRSI